MLLMTAFSAGGLLAGFLLLRRIPLVPAREAASALPGVTVVIPARNEEENLPALLQSLMDAQERPKEVVVVDDHSTDGTAAVAERFGARVLPSAPLPHGWTGKTWACYQGAMAANEEVLCFLDADTSFAPGGFGRLMRQFVGLPVNTALSVLPFHATQCWYEELSLFFNVVLAMGAGGFAGLDSPRLFGQNLILRKQLYWAAGGHETVRGEVLENLKLTPAIQTAKGAVVTRGGRGTLKMRMFPEGLKQLCVSWRKAFASGVRVTSPSVVALSVYWLGSLASVAVMLPLVWNLQVVVLYWLAVLQVAWFGRQLGSFRILAAVLYPIPLVFYFAIFGQSAWQRSRHQAILWRGRPV